MKPGHLIIINGGSSAGKTSTCCAFQGLAKEPYFRLGIDELLAIIPPKQLNLSTADSSFYQMKTYHDQGKPYFYIIPGPYLDTLMYVGYKAIANYLDAGVNVISDQLFWKKEWFYQALETFISYEVFFVGLFVSDEEGVLREQRRSLQDAENTAAGGRPDGCNRCSAMITHQNMIYDFEVDNTKLSILETAEKIKSAYEANPKPTAFKKLYALNRS